MPSHAFLIAFSITVSELWILSCILVESLEKKKKSMHCAFAMKTRYKPVSLDNDKIMPKQMSKLFRVTTSPLNTALKNAVKMSILMRLILSLQHKKYGILRNTLVVYQTKSSCRFTKRKCYAVCIIKLILIQRT